MFGIDEGVELLLVENHKLGLIQEAVLVEIVHLPYLVPLELILPDVAQRPGGPGQEGLGRLPGHS